MSTPRTSPSTRTVRVHRAERLGDGAPVIAVRRCDRPDGPMVAAVHIPIAEAPFIACDILACAVETLAVISIDSVDGLYLAPKAETGRLTLRLRADARSTLTFDLSAVATEQLIAALTPAVLTRLPDLAAGSAEQEAAIEAVVSLTPPGPIAPDAKPSFWMVKGPGPTWYEHASEADAWAEAERLASRNPGQAFSVLQTIGEAYAAPPSAPVVERTPHDPRVVDDTAL